MADAEILLIGNSNLLILWDLKDEDGLYINDAVITATLKTADGEEVSGQSWPVTVTYNGGGKGKYQAALSSTLAVVQGQKLVAEVDAVSGGLVGHWEVPAVAKTRK